MPMKTQTLTQTVAEADQAVAEARQAQLLADQQLKSAGLKLAHAVEAASAVTKKPRRERVSAVAYVEGFLERGGEVDLTKLGRDLDEAPHRWPATVRALGDLVGPLMTDYLRGAGTVAMDAEALQRLVTGYNEFRFNQLGNELATKGLNIFHLVALGFQRAGVMRPELFGTLDFATEATEIAQTNDVLAKAEKALRNSPALRHVLCVNYGVQEREEIRGGVRVPLDMTRDILDAAAAASRGSRG